MNNPNQHRIFLQRFLKSTESGPTLFIIFLILFSWPFLGMRPLENPRWMVAYLFGTWILLIFIHWLQDKINKD